MNEPLSFTLLAKILVTIIGLVVGTFVLVAKSSYSRSNKYLAIIIFIITWFQIQPVIYSQGLLSSFPWLYGIELIALFALPPTLWLYFYYNRNSNAEFSWKLAVVYVPAFVYFLGWLRYALLSPEKQEMVIKKMLVTYDFGLTVSLFGFSFEFIFAIMVVWMLTFLALMGKELYLLYKIDENGKWDVEHLKMMKKWLSGTYALVLLVVCSFFYNFYNQAVSHSGSFVPPVGFTLFRVTLLSAFMLRIVFYPEILFGIPQAKFIDNHGKLSSNGHLAETQSDAHLVAEIGEMGDDELTSIRLTQSREDLSVAVEESEEMPGISEEKSELGLPNELVTQYLDKIDQMVFDSKPFTDPEFTFEKLSRLTGIPKSHLSYVLRYHYEETFVEFRTRLRIQLAQDLIIDPANKNLTLEAIGEMVGFPSRFTFIRAFKKITNQTPGEFLDTIEK